MFLKELSLELYPVEISLHRLSAGVVISASKKFLVPPSLGREQRWDLASNGCSVNHILWTFCASDQDGSQKLCLFFLHLENPDCHLQSVVSESVANSSETVAERCKKRTGSSLPIFIKVPLRGLFQLLGWPWSSELPL